MRGKRTYFFFEKILEQYISLISFVQYVEFELYKIKHSFTVNTGYGRNSFLSLNHSNWKKMLEKVEFFSTNIMYMK